MWPRIPGSRSRRPLPGQILVGLILGDLYVRKISIKSNPHLNFEQGIIYKEYLDHLFDLFSNYCRSAPKITILRPHKITGKISSKIGFNTYSLLCFNVLCDLFYENNQKIIPSNIAELLTPRVPDMAYRPCLRSKDRFVFGLFALCWWKFSRFHLW
jgi:LAGLIDADG DNA endonuclease family